MAVLYSQHFVQFFDDNGDPLNGGKLYTYEAGTTTPKATYTTEAGDVANANPVILDSAGRATVFIDGSYKFALYTSADVLVKTTDNITSFTGAGDIPASSIATEDQAKSGVDNTKVMTPLRVHQSIGANNAHHVDFRLTLTSGTPVTTVDVIGASTVYLTPYCGDHISLFTGTYWEYIESGEISIALTGLTSGLPYDIFAYSNLGVVTLEIVAWTSDTARAIDLVLQSGVLVKTGDVTRRYLGTFYTTGTNTTEDSLTKRYLWNYYNSARRPMRRRDATASWVYSSTTTRQAYGSTDNQLNMVVGVLKDAIEASYTVRASNSGVTERQCSISIGEDSTTTPATNGVQSVIRVISSVTTSATARYIGFIPIGRHFLAALESGAGTDTQTWYGGGPFLLEGIIQG